MTDLRFDLPDHVDPAELATALAAGLVAEHEAATPIRRRYFDSFDWRLHRAGLVLVREEGRWRLRRLADDGIEAEAPAGNGPWPRFAGEFPADGRLRKRLRKLLKIRAVIHLATVSGQRRTWRVLNADRKTVLRVDLAELQSEKPVAEQVLRAVALRPVRGYEAPCERARAGALTLGLVPRERPLVDAVLAVAGIEPESYSSKFRAELTAGQTALEAGVCVGRTLLAAMRCNEAGLKQDIDTEFLHDFRVAVRRLRSALTIFKGVFAPEADEVFKREFAALGRLTGPLRDLDVYLLDEDRCRGLVPPALQPGLDPLFADLRQRRAQALAQVRRALASPAYRQLTADWKAFLTDPPPGPAADRPVLELARDGLRRRHRRVLRRGSAIAARSPAPALHRLRIDSKKLRYLLEFFASLFPAGDIAALVGHLKGLQDNLGEFNDLSVQQAMLGAALAELPARRKSSLAEAAALGGLVAALNGRQHEVRGEFEDAFGAFTRPGVNERFASLIGDAREIDA